MDDKPLKSDFGERQRHIGHDEADQDQSDKMEKSIRDLNRESQKFNRSVRLYGAALLFLVGIYFCISCLSAKFAPQSIFSHVSVLVQEGYHESSTLVAVSDAVTAIIAFTLAHYLRTNRRHASSGALRVAMVLSLIPLPLWAMVIKQSEVRALIILAVRDWILPFVGVFLAFLTYVVDHLVIISEIGMRQLGLVSRRATHRHT